MTTHVNDDEANKEVNRNNRDTKKNYPEQDLK